MKYYKILNEDELHNGFQYKTGLNIDVKKFDPEPECGGGLFFASRDILAFLCYGVWIREVTVPGGVEVVEVNDWGSQKFKASQVILGERRRVGVDSIQSLIDDGADVSGLADDHHPFLWACRNGHVDIIELLAKNGADVSVGGNYAVRWASKKGHTDTVKLLIEHGTDITAGDSQAIQLASARGHIDTVRLLIEHGADVTVGDNYAVRWARRNGHLDVMELLIEHGAEL